MKKKWITFCFILVIVTFTGIMLYIRADNNLAVRNSFSNSWRKHYVVEARQKSLGFFPKFIFLEDGHYNGSYSLWEISNSK